MTVAELKNLLKANDLARLFIFAGEEDYLKRHYLKELHRKILTDDTLAVFNHVVGEGEVIDFRMLSDALETPPMMADMKLLEWHLANIDRMKEDDLSSLKELADRCREAQSACIVIRVDKEHFDMGTLPKKPSKRYRELIESVAIVDFPRSTDSQLAAWIDKHFASEGISISPALSRALIERAGHSMDTLSNEIEKLVCALKAENRTSLAEHDLEAVTSPTAEEDAFGLSNAILSGDAATAYRKLGDLRRRRIDPLIVLGSVSKLYGEMVAICRLRDEGVPPADISRLLRIHEYPLSLRLRALQGRDESIPARALEACRALDAAAKGAGGVNTYVGLERLVAEFVR